MREAPDQWFSESQFESYRALGEAAITAMANQVASFDDFDPFLHEVNAYIAGKKETGEAKAM